MFASTFAITFMGAFVTEKIVEPKLGTYNPEEASEDLGNDKKGKLTVLEKKGLKAAGLAALAVAALLALTIVPENGILRHPETGLVAGSPFLRGIVAFIFVFFAVRALSMARWWAP